MFRKSSNFIKFFNFIGFQNKIFMVILSCRELNKSYGIDSILEDISFNINEGDKVGLVGLNGAGKTTLFKILSGQLDYDKGNIYVAKSKLVGHLKQIPDFESDSTIYEEALNVFKELIEKEKTLRNLESLIAKESQNENSKKLNQLMLDYSNLLEEFEKENGYGFKSEVRGVLKGLGFSEDEFDKKISLLSGGEKTRVLLSTLLLKKPDILLLDEPTNHLDIDAVEWLEGFLRQYDKTVILISHDRYFLDQIVNKVLEIKNKKLIEYKGNYSEFIEKKMAQEEFLIKQFQEQNEEIKRQKEIISRLKGYGNEKFVKRARSREKMIEKMPDVEKPDTFNKKASIRFEPNITSGYDVLKAENLSKSFSSKFLFEDVNFQIFRGEKVALIGPNGVGKSTLFKILQSIEEKDSGKIILGTNVHIGYYDQEQKFLNQEKSIINEIWDEYPKLTQTQIRTLLGSFLFQDEDVFKSISSLSGGEKARVSLVKLMLSDANFLFIDEPTNHLDIDSKQALENALKNYEGTLFLISHDRYFLNQVADKILVLSKNGVDEYLGNYDYYVEKKNLKDSMLEDITIEKTKTQIQYDKKKEKERQKNEKNLKKEIKNIELEIQSTESKIELINHDLCLEEIYSNPEKTKNLIKEKNILENTLENLYVEWESLLD